MVNKKGERILLTESLTVEKSIEVYKTWGASVCEYNILAIILVFVFILLIFRKSLYNRYVKNLYLCCKIFPFFVFLNFSIDVHNTILCEKEVIVFIYFIRHIDDLLFLDNILINEDIAMHKGTKISDSEEFTFQLTGLQKLKVNI